MQLSISIKSKPVYETSDGRIYNTWADASHHLLQVDIKDFVERHCYGSMSKKDMEAILEEHWAVLAIAFEAHNKRLTDGAPQS